MRLSIELADNRVELIEIAILDAQRAALPAVIDAHREAQRIRQPLLQRLGVGVLGP